MLPRNAGECPTDPAYQRLKRAATAVSLVVGAITIAVFFIRSIGALAQLAISVRDLSATVQEFRPTVARLDSHLARVDTALAALRAEQAREENRTAQLQVVVRRNTAALARLGGAP